MLRCEHIRKAYGTLQVLDDVSLSVNPGEVVAILGASGAGKTTLLQILGTLLSPDSGIVTIDDTATCSLSDKSLAALRCNTLGFVFQHHSLLPEFTLLENVAMPALIRGCSRREADSRAMELIDYLGLHGRIGHKPSQLSGGERQRAAVARALVNSPRYVLADEPSGSLDSRNRDELHDLFLNIRRDRGSAFVIVTHDESMARGSDRIVRMQDGKILA